MTEQPPPATPEMATWWTPDGWRREPMPEAFQAATAAEGDWDDALRRNGYGVRVLGREYTDVSTSVWVNGTGGHLLVEINSGDDDNSLFFVGIGDDAAFMADKYVELQAASAAARQAEALETIAKTLIAFVRHGQGTDTIDSYGSQTKDDELARRREQARKTKPT